MEFIAVSDYLKQVKRVAEQGAQLQMNLYIWGETGTGRHFLAHYIGSLAPIKPLILEGKELERFQSQNRFVIGIGETPLSTLPNRGLFDTDIYLSPLREHPEDIPAFSTHFHREALRTLRLKRDLPPFSPDLSENLHSLKRQIYRLLLTPSTLREFEECCYNFFRMSPSYRWQELEIGFTRGILWGARELFKTKVKISQKLRINRVTLTKKMKELLDG
ncbi:MAG: hypothetical protein ABGW77_06770 [Campylobacterales bacterium]